MFIFSVEMRNTYFYLFLITVGIANNEVSEYFIVSKKN